MLVLFINHEVFLLLIIFDTFLCRLNSMSQRYRLLEPTTAQAMIDETIKESLSQKPITVFIGNITDKASDLLIQQILIKCGLILNWKRAKGLGNILQAFGYCEYADPASALTAIRILNGFKVGDKQLLVKVDAKTREILDSYKNLVNKDLICLGEDGETYDFETDERMLEEDVEIVEDINRLLEGFGEFHLLHQCKETHTGNVDNLAGLKMTDADKKIVSREIRRFRATYSANETDANQRLSRKREREGDRLRHSHADDEGEKERSQEIERNRHSDSDGGKDTNRHGDSSGGHEGKRRKSKRKKKSKKKPKKEQCYEHRRHEKNDNKENGFYGNYGRKDWPYY